MKNKKDTISKFINYENLDKIGEIAVYYGFTPHKSPSITKIDLDAVKDIVDGDYIDDETDSHNRLALHVEEKMALIRMYNEENMHTEPQPVMLYFKDPCKGSKGHRYADLEILGPSGPIAEATLIQTAKIMLEEEGIENMIVEINSIGDKDSMARFTRELTAYYRKHINEMSADARELFKKDPFELLSFQDKSCTELNSKAPRALDYLSENSRRHLEEILEYLEALKISYNVNNNLVGNRKYCGETIFNIVSGEKTAKDRKVVAVGMRYNNLGKRLTLKKDIQGVGISLLIKNGKNDNRKPLKKVKRPIASFVQLGLQSKLLSLEIIENLRKAKVPLYLSLAKDRLGAQVSSVEKYHTPYVIVIGKKEAVERTAIVRENERHSQDIVTLEELPKHMKKIEGEYFK
jgi:histidyl-tRNA synthetase